jgi:hypothetical protein
LEEKIAWLMDMIERLLASSRNLSGTEEEGEE